jgi:hypothetical protein
VTRNLKGDWLITRGNNDSECEERAALALQFDDVKEFRQRFGSGLKAILIAKRQ